MRVLQEIYGNAASDVKAALTNGHVGPGGQLSEAVLRDYHFYGHAAAGRLAIATERATAILRGGEGVNLGPPGRALAGPVLECIRFTWVDPVASPLA